MEDWYEYFYLVTTGNRVGQDAKSSVMRPWIRSQNQRANQGVRVSREPICIDLVIASC